MAHRCVVVGSDGSDSALDAVRTAAEVAQSAGARLIVVTAYDPGAGEGHLVKAVSAETRARVQGDSEAQQVSQASLEVAQEICPEAEATIVRGDPVETLLQTVERQQGDLIVVGNRGINSKARRIVGSVPSNVVFRAPCDVLVAHTS